MVPRCLVLYGSAGRNGRVWWLDSLESTVNTDGGTGVLVGSESKFGSTEDEGIGADPVEGGLDMIEVQNTATRISLRHQSRHYPKEHNRHSYSKPVS